jgi:hypothetical protein
MEGEMPWFIPYQSARQPSLILTEGRYENEKEAWNAYEKLQADDTREDIRYGLPFEASDYAKAQETAIAVMTSRQNPAIIISAKSQP